MAKLITGSDSRLNTASVVLESLCVFAKWQYQFFHLGFTPATGTTTVDGFHDGFLDFDPIYPAEYALELTAEQIANDKDVLLRIIGHRHQDVATYKMRDRLTTADQLAYHALKVAFKEPDESTGPGLIAPSTVLTYFQKSPSIRLIPYAPVAFVGLPLTPEGDVGTYRDLLAIAHEIGHHVYWRRLQDNPTARVGDAFQEELEKALARLPQWVRNWKEEIFADLYSFLIAGPVSILSIQELMKTVPAHRAVHDDRHYPAPVVRPQIQLAALKALAETVNDGPQKERLLRAGEVLKTRWEDWNSKRGIPMWFIPFGEEEPITILKVEEILEQVVGAIMTPFFSFLLPTQRANFWDEWWSSGLEEGEDSRQLILQFKAYVDKVMLTPLTVPELELIDTQGKKYIQLTVDGAPHGDPILLGTTGLNLPFEGLRDAALYSGEKPSQIQGDRAWWLPVLEAAFWTTEGPDAADDP